MKKATQRQTKEHNRNLVLKTLFEHERISRAEIARLTTLTRTTVSDIVADHIAEGLAREVGFGSSLGGKTPILLSLMADARHVIGVDLAQDSFTGAVVDLRGRVTEEAEQVVPPRDGDAAVAALYALLDTLVRQARTPIAGIGIGTPGLVDAQSGVVVSAVNLGWQRLPLGRLVQARYHVPVCVLNDSQAAAMGEYTFGEAHPARSNLVVINVRYGIGAGIILNGEIFHGDGGGAGEIGHVVVVREGGTPCGCGNLGCLETVASTHAIVERARTMVRHAKVAALGRAPERITLDAIERAFTGGDPLARQVVLEAGRFMGMAISSLVGTLNIRRIILAGDLTRFGRPLLDTVMATLSQTMLARLVEGTRVDVGQLGSRAIVLGACALILKDYSLLFRRPAEGSRAATP
jgi:glucokinase-like ROK family protein